MNASPAGHATPLPPFSESAPVARTARPIRAWCPGRRYRGAGHEAQIASARCALLFLERVTCALDPCGFGVHA